MTVLGAGARRIGLLADTHSMKGDGSDLPAAVLAAFDGCDLIVHLGDVGRKGILDRLGAVAPVLVPFGANKGYLRHGTQDRPEKVLRSGQGTVGLWFKHHAARQEDQHHRRRAGVRRPVGEAAPAPLQQPVDVVAFAGTHRPMVQEHGGVLFVNPGSPTLPEGDAPASVAIIDLTQPTPIAHTLSI